ncbi:Hypothetical protein A7982_09907 [Minicystis rosea]|nr:Hypothetical protein A7982_09907 [Minicystis rosea]
MLLALPALVLVALGLGASYSPSGWLMLLALALVVAGMITAPGGALAVAASPARGSRCSASWSSGV